MGKGPSCARLRNALHQWGDVPTSLAATKLLEIDTGALVAGARLRGEIEERVKKLLSDLAGSTAILSGAQSGAAVRPRSASGTARSVEVLKPALVPR